MSKLFQRDWRVIVDGHVIDQLRVQFHVTKTADKTPNTCDLIITNLSADSRSKMKAHGMSVIIEAGYKDTRSVIFSGDSRICDHTHKNAEWLTKIQCGDGEKIYQYKRLNQSFAAGTQVVQAIRAAANAMGVNLGNLNDALNEGGVEPNKFEHGFAAFGNAASVFNKLITSAGYTWSIQQGALVVAKKGQPAVQEVVVLSAKTGLLESPEHSPPNKTKKQTTLVAKSLLNPKIRPGVLVRMDSLQVKGDFVPQKVEHVGDSHLGPWTTHFEALSSNQKVQVVS